MLGLLGDLEKNRFEIFRSLTLIRQASLDAALIDSAHANIPSTKLDVLMELLTEIASEGHRTLVFSQFTRFLEAARRRLDADGIEYIYLDGSTRNRAAVLAEFKNGTAPVFPDQPQGRRLRPQSNRGRLLHARPVVESGDRGSGGRPGAPDRPDEEGHGLPAGRQEKVVALKAAKAALFGSVMDDGEFSSGALTAADIRGMLE